MKLSDYEYLWNEGKDDYVIVQLTADDPESRIIYCVLDQTALLVEDEQLLGELVNNMLAHGVPVVSKIPSAESIGTPPESQAKSSRRG